MCAAHKQMYDVYKCETCSLKVRVNHTAATNLLNKLGYTIRDVDKKYYTDGEDAYEMTLELRSDQSENGCTEEKKICDEETP